VLYEVSLLQRQRGAENLLQTRVNLHQTVPEVMTDMILLPGKKTAVLEPSSERDGPERGEALGHLF